MEFKSIGRLAKRNFYEENKSRKGRKFAFLAFGVRREERQVDSFRWLGMTWHIRLGQWTNGGRCLVVEQRETEVGLALLEAGHGEYSSSQCEPQQLLWDAEDWYVFMEENMYKINKKDNCGRYSGITIENTAE